MTRTWKRLSFALSGLWLLAAWPAHAEVSSLGKGWLLGSAGSITSTLAEVISGSHSVKGSYSGPDTQLVKPFLDSDPTFIRLAPNQTYTITASYRILDKGSLGFTFGFFSAIGSGQRRFLPTRVVDYPSGTSGSESLTVTLDSFPDYRASFSVVGTGTFVIDDVRITDSAGRLVAAESVAGPTLAPGPFNFRITEAIALLTPASSAPISAAVNDLDGDGHPETILALTAPRPSATPLEPIIVESRGSMRVATPEFFPAGVPRVKNSPMTEYIDINNDGLKDIVFADAGSDAPPFPGSGIGIGLNVGGGRYRDVSALVPADLQTGRSYTVAAGDIDGDGRVEIILPDQSRGNTATLRWNGAGFDANRNWISPSLWTGLDFHWQTWMNLADFDRDGRQDLLVSGMERSPNLRVLFGAPEGFTAAGLVQLPDGPWGWSPAPPRQPIVQGAEVGPVVVADFNNDGLPDIFAIEDRIVTYAPGTITDPNIEDFDAIRAKGGVVPQEVSFQVFLNQGSRRFLDVSARSSQLNLGWRHYNALVTVDVNNDRFPDLVGVYQQNRYGARRGGEWGTTAFVNDGAGGFFVVDGVEFLAVTTSPSNGQRWNLGAFVPTVLTPGRIEGIVFEPVGGCGLGFCAATGLNLYKVVLN